MSRRGLIGSASGLVFAVLLIYAVAELSAQYFIRMSLRAYDTAVWSGLGFVILGVTLGVAYRAGRKHTWFLGTAAGALAFVYIVGPQVNPLFGINPSVRSLWVQFGPGSAAGLIVGVLLVATLLSLRGEPRLREVGPMRGAIAAMVIGLLLAPLLLTVLRGLETSLHQAASMQNWPGLRWTMFGLVLFGMGFAWLVWAAPVRRSLRLGMLTGLALLILSHPGFWEPDIPLATFMFQIRMVAMLPVVLIMAGMLLVAVFPNRRAVDQSPGPVADSAVMIRS